MNRATFSQFFSIGEEVDSGGPRSKLRIAAIKESSFTVIPIRGLHQATASMRYTQLAAVIEGFEQIHPKKIAPTIRPVLLAARLKEEHTVENYLYGFAREFIKRTSLEPSEARVSTSGETIPPAKILEGAPRQVLLTVRERDPRARAMCIAHWGVKCCVCDLEFSAKYGELGRGFIHVHHSHPLKDQLGEHEVNPIDDLRPVCPNCHAMLHRDELVSSVEELRRIVSSNVNGSA